MLAGTKQTRQLLQPHWPVTQAGFIPIKSVGCQSQGLRREATAAGLSASLVRLFDKLLKHMTATDIIHA